MTRISEWLLDLEQIRLGRDAPLSLRWHPPYEPYLLFAFYVLLLAFVVIVCRRESIGRGRRIVLGILRGGLIALVVAVICRPTLVLQRERVEPSRVALLIDTSQSMARTEAYYDKGLAAAVAAGAGIEDAHQLKEHPRLELGLRALLHDDAAPLKAVLSHHELLTLLFDDSTRSWGLVREDAELQALADSLSSVSASGTNTDLPDALTATITQHGSGRLAGMVLLSDGRSTVPTDVISALGAAKARKVPVYPLRIGSPTPRRNVAVGPLIAEENVFADDLVALRCRVTADGLDEGTAMTFQLVDESSGAVVATQSREFDPDQRRMDIEFRVRPARAGKVTYRVEAAVLPDEEDASDNVATADVQVLEEKLRVLYVEGPPRLEYRYFKNALLREETIESSCLLLSADSNFAQEGTYPIRRFPETREELYRYDVVLMGDVDPTGDWLSPASAQMLVDFVADHGGGFGLIAGERNAPHRFQGTPLEKLVPVRLDPEFAGRYASTLTYPFQPRLTIEGKHARCFRFDRDPQVSQQRFESLPGLYWIARTLGPRPGAETLLEHPAMQSIDGAMPVMVMGRYGAGKVFFSATDETWRWRRHTGEFVHDIFVVQLVRMLMKPADLARDRRAELTTDRRRYAYGDRIEARLEVADTDLLATLGQQATLVLTTSAGVPVGRFRADRIDENADGFEASIVAPRAGSFVLSCQEFVPRPGDRAVTAAIQVETADLEAKHPEADHALLARIAAETGGEVVDLDRLAEVVTKIRDRSLRIPDDISEPLWDSRLVFILFGLMITMEWVLRKAFGMV